MAAAAGLGVLAVVTWVVLWIRPPQPARLVVLQAGYDATLAVPPNPYGKAAARSLASLATPGSWFGNRAKLHGNPTPDRLLRPGPSTVLPSLGEGHEQCVVVVVAAHGGRDRDGAFLFPDDATPDPAHRLRIQAVIDRFGQLPPGRQKLLILDATQCPAFPDLGLVHNDFAAAVEELNDAVARVPNLVVYMSTGADQRSWACPEWGTTTFARFLDEGLKGAADANHDRRVNGWELVEYVSPRVRDWARDHRAALQSPVLLPQGEEGERRVRAMHIVMAEGKLPAPTAPTPFEPPAEIGQAWEEYRTLANGTPPPQAYTPHLWRQYESWLLRYEQHLMAGDAEGAQAARDKASRVRRQIEDDRRLAVRPQTLALPAGVGSVRHVEKVPEPFRLGIARVANPDPSVTSAERLKEWEQAQKLATGIDAEAARLLWGYALMAYVAEDPAGRLPVVPAVLPLLEGGFAVRPAELHFLAMLAARLPQPDPSTGLGPLLKNTLTLRTLAEEAAACVPDAGGPRLQAMLAARLVQLDLFADLGSLLKSALALRTLAEGVACGPGSGYPYAEFCQKWVLADVLLGDAARRQAEDLCFATGEANWATATARANEATRHYRSAREKAAHVRALVTAWQAGAARVPELGEWVTRDLTWRKVGDRLTREAEFRAYLTVWGRIHSAGKSAWAAGGRPSDFDQLSGELDGQLRTLDARLARQIGQLLQTRPEFEGKVTPRPEAVRWWHEAEAVLTAPPAVDAEPTRRVDLLRELRRVSRQLLVMAATRPEPLPAVSAAVTREQAFDAARWRGLLMLSRIGREEFDRLAARKPGHGYAQVEFRLNEFGFPAAGRQLLAEVGSQLGEILNAIPTVLDAAGATADADRLIRISPAPTVEAISGKPALQLRRVEIYELLLNQARRTLEDHWYDERGDRYYRNAIDLLATDANRIRTSTATAQDPFASLKAATEEFPVQPTALSRIAVTDEPSPEVAIALDRKVGISGRPGFAVFWVDPPFPPVPGKNDPPVLPDYAPVSTDPAAPLTPLVRSVRRPSGPEPTTPRARSGPLKVNGFYRGRLLPQSTTVDFYSVPNQAAVTTPPTDPYAKLAVRADPFIGPKYAIGSGSVAVVLDCSGSMRPNPAVRGDRGLYPVAVDALRDVLTVLPPGATVSVRTFGKRTPGAKSAEETIQVMTPPTRLSLEDRGQVVSGVVAEASAVTVNDLYDWSPVVRAVLEAKESLKSAPGPFKAVVLISDAVDTRFAEDPKFTHPPKRSIKEVLRAEFSASGVPLCVVALPVANPADVAAQKEFEVVKALRPAGLFVPPEKAKDVGAWLRSGMSPRLRYHVRPLEADAPVTPFDLTATTEAPDDWFAGNLPRGRYQVEVVGNLNFRHEVRLNPGDRLLLDLFEDQGRLSLKRHWFAATWPALARSGGEDPTRKLALLQNRLDGGKVRMVASIEDRPKDRPRATDAVSAYRVGDVWFEVGPAVPRPDPVAVRWRAVSGFPAPSWSIDAVGWPAAPGGKGAAATQMGAWWSPDRPFPQTGAVWSPPAGAKLVGTRAASIPLEGGVSATLDAVTIESHSVEVRPGVSEKRPCLVARLTYPTDRVAWLRPASPRNPLGQAERGPAGSEVRFYREAHKVTCLYWWDNAPLTADDVAGRVVGLEVVTLATVRAGPHLELQNPPAPSETSPIADPPAGKR